MRVSDPLRVVMMRFEAGTFPTSILRLLSAMCTLLLALYRAAGVVCLDAQDN